jgi:hypothetical protein
MKQTIKTRSGRVLVLPRPAEDAAIAAGIAQDPETYEPNALELGRYELVAATRSITELKGMFGVSTRTVSVKEMNRDIATQGASARGAPD